MVGRERELEKLDCVLRGCGRGRGSPAPARRRGRGRQDAASGGGHCRGEPRLPTGSRGRTRVVAVCADHARCSVNSCAGEPAGLSGPRTARRTSRRAAARARAGAERHRSRDPDRGRAIRLRDDRSAAQATVVFLDDLHWADAATLELLPSLAEAVGGVAAPRARRLPQRGDPAWPPAAQAPHRTCVVPAASSSSVVEPLDAAATAGLAAHASSTGSRARRFSAALYDRTQGVPFFVEELAAALGDGARLVPGPNGLELEDGSDVPIPETLRDALRIRAEGLSDEGRATLEAASVIGIDVELDLLACPGLRRRPERGFRPRAAQRGRARDGRVSA